MKIHEGQGPVIGDMGKAAGKKGPGGDDFKKIMENFTSGTETVQSSAGSVLNGVNNIESVIGINRITPVNAVPFSNDKRMMLDSLHETLNLIEFYAGKLGDGNISAGELSPMVEELEGRLETLKNAGKGDNIPEPLKPVISEMTVTIGAEIERFKRGDYV